MPRQMASADWREQAARAERAHQLAEMADAGKNQRAGGGDRFRRGRAFGLDALPRQRALHRRQIARVVFDQRNFHDFTEPLVLGSTRFSCGSRVAANRNARAKALKSAST